MLGSAVPLVIFLLLIREALVRSIVLYSVRAEDAKEPIIFVGPERSIEEFERGLPEEIVGNYRVVARFDPQAGGVVEFLGLLKREAVGRAIFGIRWRAFTDRLQGLPGKDEIRRQRQSRRTGRFSAGREPVELTFL